MIDCYLSLGSNLGNPAENISQAIALIAQETDLISQSNFYSSAPVGFISDNQFMNTCIHVKTGKSAMELLTILKRIELILGRTEKSVNNSYCDRIIDIDILFFGNQIIDTIELSVPHKKYNERAFVLIPLAEIAPIFQDPQTKLTIQQYLNNIS